MSQCSHPCVWEMKATEFCVPPTTNPAASRASMSGSTLLSSSTMNSMLLRMVKRTWPSAYLSPMSHSLRSVNTSRIRWVPARTVQISSPLSATWQSTPTLGWV